ncbi:hypothetical protein D3C79_286940 [compost metagenome]
MKQKSMIEAAHDMAELAHLGQKYDGVFDYLNFHVKGVCDKYLALFGSYGDYGHAVAMLHDVVEDSSKTIEDVINMFGFNVGEAVHAITKLKGERRLDYLSRCCANDIARKVKIADTLFNLEYSIKKQDQKRIEKYTNQLSLLTSNKGDNHETK